MPHSKQEPMPTIERGVRYGVVTWTRDEYGEPVPVSWTFADRAGAEKLAKMAGVAVTVVRRAVQADHGDSDAW